MAPTPGLARAVVRSRGGELRVLARAGEAAAALAPLRAAARRGVERCGRVRGRLVRTPCSFRADAPSLALRSDTPT